MISRFRYASLLALAAAMLVAAFAISGCGSSEEPVTGATGSENTTAGGGSTSAGITVNMQTPPTSLDPANQCNVTDGVVGNFYARLVEFGVKPGPDGTNEVDQSKLVPGLAESWNVSPDGKTYTFILRKGLEFSNGDPLTAEDVAFSFERVQEMEICSAYDVNTADTENVTSTKAVGPLKFQITMKKPNPHLIYSWATPALGIVDKAVVEAHGGVVPGKPNEYVATNTVSSGPYVASGYQPGVKLEMTANPHYYGKPALTQKVTVNYISSDSTLQLDAKNGAADVTFQMSKLGARSIADEEGDLKVVPYEATNTEQVVLNWDKKPLDNQKVREALAYAVPYEDLVEKVAQGYGVAFSGPILPTMPYFDEELGKPHPYDVEKAEALLKESGESLPLQITLTIPEGNTVEQQLATVLQSAWKQIGVDLQVRTLSSAAYTTALFSNDDQAALRNDGPFVNDPDYYLGYDLACGKGEIENTGNICIPAADANMLEARRTEDEAEAAALYKQVTEEWQAQTPKIFLYLDDQVVVLAPTVTEFTWDPSYSSFALIAAEG